MLQAQIQIHPTLRSYQPEEKEKLGELFGAPDRWGQTLRARFWTHANVNVPQFSGKTEAILSVPCTFDLNVAATKYFYALEDGEAPLLFLFSGTIFYQNADERLQIQQVSWNKECTYRLPISVWKEMMDHHYPNTAWLSLERDLFERFMLFGGARDWRLGRPDLLERHPASRMNETEKWSREPCKTRPMSEPKDAPGVHHTPPSDPLLRPAPDKK